MYLIFERNCEKTRLRPRVHVIDHSVHLQGFSSGHACLLRTSPPTTDEEPIRFLNFYFELSTFEMYTTMCQ